MSNQMQLARLRVPVECLMDDQIAIAQLASAAAEAADEIERLRAALDDVADHYRTQYLTDDEREKLQAVLNANIRQLLDAMPNAEKLARAL